MGGPLDRWSVGRMVHRMDGWRVCWMEARIVRNPIFFFLMPKMKGFLYEKYWGGPTLTSLNVLGVIDVLNVLSILNQLHEQNVHNAPNMLNVLIMLKDTSFACWAFFC